MKNIQLRTLGEIVTANYKAATVFEKHQLDFCCQGNRTLLQACEKAGIDVGTVSEEINSLTLEDSATDFTTWPLALLADYIYQRHHSYVEKVTPTIKNLLDKISLKHGAAHPELNEIREIFNTSSGALAAHMKKEELILFPFIKKLAAARSANIPASSTLFASVQNPIEMMEDDHLDEGQQLEQMARLSNNYTAPADACLSYKTAFAMLKEYEKDMHLHIHLENNILFPSAIRLEKELPLL